VTLYHADLARELEALERRYDAHSNLSSMPSANSQVRRPSRRAAASGLRETVRSKASTPE
jgi:hypothetical protein